MITVRAQLECDVCARLGGPVSLPLTWNGGIDWRQGANPLHRPDGLPSDYSIGTVRAALEVGFVEPWLAVGDGHGAKIFCSRICAREWARTEQLATS